MVHQVEMGTVHRVFAPGASEAGCETWARGWGPHGWVTAPSSPPLFLGPGNGTEDTATAICLPALAEPSVLGGKGRYLCIRERHWQLLLISYDKMEALK